MKNFKVTFRDGKENQQNQEKIWDLLAMDVNEAIHNFEIFMSDQTFVFIKMQKFMLFSSTDQFASYNSYKFQAKSTGFRQLILRNSIKVMLESLESNKKNFL